MEMIDKFYYKLKVLSQVQSQQMESLIQSINIHQLVCDCVTKWVITNLNMILLNLNIKPCTFCCQILK